MAKRVKPNGGTVARNPERTRERILSAALKEFAAHGFAGARVDVIARRAAINKRMLYHYFGDKENLFKAVLRRKISERQAWAEASSGEPTETLPFWFEAACKDADWVRLLEWEALQGGKKVIDEKERRAAVERSLERIRRRQERGQISSEFDPRHVILAIRSLTMFPVAFPQLTELIMGKSVFDPKFQHERVEFLKKFAVVFRPAGVQTVKYVLPSKSHETGFHFDQHPNAIKRTH
jgi:TetR/AcrR family transcriptional regulator